MSMSRAPLLRRLTRLANTMVQGGLSETSRTCGNPGCRCHQGQRHGPHLYLTFRTGEGRSSALYIPREGEAEVRRVLHAWAAFWQTGVALSHLNRQALRKRLRTRRTDAAKGKR
jgi:hypothetical protein